MKLNSFGTQNQPAFGSKFTVNTFPVKIIANNEALPTSFIRVPGKINDRNARFNGTIFRFFDKLSKQFKGTFSFNKDSKALTLTVRHKFDKPVEKELTKLKEYLDFRQLATKDSDKIDFNWTKK